MGLLTNLAMMGVLGFGLSRIRKDWKRSNTPCDLSEGITEDDLLRMAKRAKRGIKRLVSVDVNGPMVYGTVRSQSGVSEWDFSVDFNDWGHITGSYWINSENDDSGIPKLVAERISDAISDRLAEIEEDSQSSSATCCPECGSEITDSDARFCNKCGASLTELEPDEVKEDEGEVLDPSTKTTIGILIVLFLICLISLLIPVLDYHL